MVIKIDTSGIMQRVSNAWLLRSDQKTIIFDIRKMDYCWQI